MNAKQIWESNKRFISEKQKVQSELIFKISANRVEPALGRVKI